jgi:transcriptional regulator GlxA family with amidase domain
MNIAIIDYPDALQSAVFGLREIFLLANQLCVEHQLLQKFNIDIVGLEQMAEPLSNDKIYTAVILPPSLVRGFYLSPAESLKKWLVDKHGCGSILCSVCAGSFIIASTGLLDEREATTHWGLVAAFNARYPDVKLNTNKIIVNDGDIISAGGMMSWLDLSLELVAQFTNPNITRQLGKMLVVDTGQREQRYYQQFSPKLTHGDATILRVQRKLQTDYMLENKVTELAQLCNLTERTFLRHFVNATGIKPREYIQRLRIQKVCDLLETTKDTFEMIANSVGYEDVGACRKIFVRIMGLTPREFGKRFVNDRS